ncbi:NAD(P)/FAD-dependent oxidoreductase [Roseobacter sp. S98]|uniref:NAD(P)/FAD-dependent oxidoreductase n=1 Tax=Roseobacter algicola (ex Choi et al. 2025) (nom. illeg.) TaxID=3092138 RepID=UPI003F519E54
MERSVTVLGAGIVGICTALSLAERGVRVRVIDRSDPGQETSFGNAGVISPWSIIPQSLPGTWRQIPQLMWGRYRPLSVRLQTWPAMIPWGLRFLRRGTEQKVREAADAMEHLCGPGIELYRRHLEGTGGENLVADSMYVHAFRDGSRASLRSLDYAIRSEKGAELELIGQDELRRTEPALHPEFQAAVLVKGQARALSPGHIGTVLADKARRLGVTFVRDSIQRLEAKDGGWQVVCDGQTFECPDVVVAMGAWSAALLDPLGLKMPLMAERGYHVEFPQPGITLNNSVMDVDAKFVASSMEDGLRVAGQAEFGPVDAPPAPRRKDQLVRQARQTFPDIDLSAPRFWMGRRPSFPDSLPALGGVKGRQGLYLNFGHSHYGLMMAPRSGELVSDLVTGRMPNANFPQISPERFA